MTWERFTEAMTLLRGCYPGVPNDEWSRIARTTYARLRRYDESTVIKALRACPERWRRRPPTPVEFEELCREHEEPKHVRGARAVSAILSGLERREYKAMQDPKWLASQLERGSR